MDSISPRTHPFNADSHDPRAILPISLHTIFGLIAFDAEHTRFRAPLPVSLHTIFGLIAFDAEHTRFRGTLPVSLHTIFGLIAFDAEHTRFRGTFVGLAAHNLRMIAFQSPAPAALAAQDREQKEKAEPKIRF
jgi:hypothetical protein